MKTFLSDFFPKIQRFSEKLDNLVLLTDQHWVSIGDIASTKTVYIFRNNNELLVSVNGKVEKARWEYLGNKSLLIDKKEESWLFKHGFFDDSILALKVDASEEYVIFVNENKYEGELNSLERIIDFLHQKYLDPQIKGAIETSTGQTIKVSNFSDLQIVYRELGDGRTMKIISEGQTTIGARVFINERMAIDGIYIYKTKTHKLIVKDGKIVERYFLEYFKEYLFEKKYNTEPNIGDNVFFSNGQPVKEAKIKYNFFKSFKVLNGKITS